jgi:hypothetical protein
LKLKRRMPCSPGRVTTLPRAPTAAAAENTFHDQFNNQYAQPAMLAGQLTQTQHHVTPEPRRNTATYFMVAHSRSAIDPRSSRCHQDNEVEQNQQNSTYSQQQQQHNKVCAYMMLMPRWMVVHLLLPPLRLHLAMFYSVGKCIAQQ